jgi:hypothetical protein
MLFGCRAVVSLGLAASLAGACGPDVCTADLACGAQSTVDMSLLTAPIATLSADAPCSATDKADVMVTMNGSFGGSAGSCQIHATLTDGSTWVAVLSWVPDTSVCCHGSTHNVGPRPQFMRDNSDGGT